ncbi:hypothetical protein PIIN_10346 [Serendipita indica DSM 11827]|uniref:Uncharacterized protein n=1 Tax=Serendipita indica (strain DSM 11827) TaxID=1109443 RepID=G4TYF9_SERID|nr:hypothetical protein PIIN_10346 [Serendipita indica DSM 11827]
MPSKTSDTGRTAALAVDGCQYICLSAILFVSVYSINCDIEVQAAPRKLWAPPCPALTLDPIWRSYQAIHDSMASRQSSNIRGDFPVDRLGPSDDCVGCLSLGAEQRSYTGLVEPMLCKFFNPAIDALFDHVRKVLLTLLEAKFKAFPQALLVTHTKYLTVITDDKPNASRTATPGPAHDHAASFLPPSITTTTKNAS